MSNGWPAIDFGHTGIEAAFARGEVTDDERRAVLVAIEQRHPTPSA